MYTYIYKEVQTLEKTNEINETSLLEKCADQISCKPKTLYTPVKAICNDCNIVCGEYGRTSVCYPKVVCRGVEE